MISALPWNRPALLLGALRGLLEGALVQSVNEARQVNAILMMPSPTISVTMAEVSIWFGAPPASLIMCESCLL